MRKNEATMLESIRVLETNYVSLYASTVKQIHELKMETLKKYDDMLNMLRNIRQAQSEFEKKLNKCKDENGFLHCDIAETLYKTNELEEGVKKTLDKMRELEEEIKKLKKRKR